MVGLRVLPTPQANEQLLPFLSLIRMCKHSWSPVLQRSYLDTDTVPLGAPSPHSPLRTSAGLGAAGRRAVTGGQRRVDN